MQQHPYYFSFNPMIYQKIIGYNFLPQNLEQKPSSFSVLINSDNYQLVTLANQNIYDLNEIYIANSTLAIYRIILQQILPSVKIIANSNVVNMAFQMVQHQLKGIAVVMDKPFTHLN